ncbi:MAG: M48 family metalloprotease [Gammaproteobacteria bacterium]|nr:M48 family metalloprotease [Gammaproteobacteria bacterium]
MIKDVYRLAQTGISLILIVFLCAPAAAEVTTLDLPDIGDSTGGLLSPEFERRLGQAFLSRVRKQADLVADPEVNTYIESIGYRLVSQSDNNEQQFTFFVINDSLINAFAAPGGIIGINSGVILNADSESELAGVMAHEVAHVTQKHMARSVEMSKKMSIPTLAAMLGAILVATQNPEAGQAALMAVQGVSAQAQINFTRTNEQEADRIGIQLLARSGFDPRGMTGFFRKLQQSSRFSAQAPEFLRTHPLTTRRIADASARAAAYSGALEVEESMSFPLVKAKLIVSSHKAPGEAVEYFSRRLAGAGRGGASEADRYGYIIALTAAGQYALAREQARRLLSGDPENVAYLLAAADIEVRQGNYDAAFEIFSKTERLYPDYRPLVLNFANALLKAGQPGLARDKLREFGRFQTPDITYFDYLTRAEAEAGDQVESSIANAEYYFLTGETRVAIEQLRHLLRQQAPRPDYYQSERIRARMAFLEQELELERAMKLRK